MGDPFAMVDHLVFTARRYCDTLEVGIEVRVYNPGLDKRSGTWGMIAEAFPRVVDTRGHDEGPHYTVEFSDGVTAYYPARLLVP